MPSPADAARRFCYPGSLLSGADGGIGRNAGNWRAGGQLGETAAFETGRKIRVGRPDEDAADEQTGKREYGQDRDRPAKRWLIPAPAAHG